MTNSERAFNLLAGISVLSWAILGMVATDVSSRWTVVRVGIAVLNAVVGVLFLVRKPLVYQGDSLGMLLCLPSFVVCGLAFKLTPPADTWSIASQATFAFGTVLAVVSCVCLGRCFAVLPAVRSVVANGPYRFVRHPAYAGELLMMLGCFLSDPRPIQVWPVAAAVPLIVIRIRVEERLLHREPEYQAYANSVRWRFVPGVW